MGGAVQHAGPPFRAAVIEDDCRFLGALAGAIEEAPDMQLAGCAETHAGGRRLIEGQELDILLVDLGLPDGDGIDLIGRAKRQQPACELMVITTFNDESHILSAIEAGAGGYLLKDGPAADIVPQLRNLLAGGSPISPLIARKLLQRLQCDTGATAASPSPATPLSSREQYVLKQFTLGLTYKEVTRQLAVSPHTVQTFVRRLYRKLRVSSKSEAVFEAQRRSLLDE